jgi:enterobactin synthetase component D
MRISRYALGGRMPGALEGSMPDVRLAYFVASSFDRSQFVTHGFDCPPSVARSVVTRQAEYLAGRLAAIDALREHGVTLRDLPMGPLRLPIWPIGYTGSISHASGIAAAIALAAVGIRGVGLDVEHLATPQAQEAIRATVVDAKECAVLSSLASATSWSFALTTAFSAKESFYKATSHTVGRIFDFSALRIVGCCLGQRSLQAEVAEPLADSLCMGTRVNLAYAHIDETTILTSHAW